MKGLLPVLILVAALVMAEGAIGQDPGRIDSLAFGNQDGTPILVNINVDVSVPVWLKCDENVAFVNLSLATQNEFVASRLGGVAIGPLAGWNLQFLGPANNWPQPGLTSQTFLGIADFALPQPNYINTYEQWVLIGAFKIHTTDSPSAMGRQSPLFPGEDPTQGLTVIFDEFWNPIVPAMRFSQLRFQSTTNPPHIISPPDNAIYSLNGLFPFSIPFIASDPDSDAITMSVDFPYTGSTLTPKEIRPGYARYSFDWTPPQNLQVNVPANFIATDINRATDVNSISLDVKPVVLSVAIDSTFPGYPAMVDVSLNQLGSNSTIASFNILFIFDGVSLNVDSVIFLDSIARWEYKNVTRNPQGPGSLRLLAVANMYNHGVPPLQDGNYKLARIKLSTTNNPNLVGMFLPLSMPTNDLTKNVLSDTSGYLVFHPAIREGGVMFLPSDDYLIGDINLNGAPFEIGDAVVLSEYLIDPFNHPLNPIQMAAADCNQDGLSATVADLIYLINVINGTIPPPRLNPLPGLANLNILSSGNSIQLQLKSEAPVGGILVKLAHIGSKITNVQAPAGLLVKFSDINNILTAIVYSADGKTPLTNEILSFDISEGNAQNISIDYSEVSDIYGRLMQK